MQRTHFPNGMCDSLFDIYQFHESAKILWDILVDKYMSEYASSKKFLVSNFNNYKMLYNHPVMDQFHELQCMYNNMKVHDITMDEIYIVSTIIDKLPNDKPRCYLLFGNNIVNYSLVSVHSNFFWLVLRPFVGQHFIFNFFFSLFFPFLFL